MLARRSTSPWRRLGWVSALATAAVIALLVYGVLPRLGAPTTLSASEILNRSLQTMSSGQGVEMLEYEVAMDGMTDGPVVIRQVIDRDNPHRYKVASYRPDGVIATAISQDPIAQRRSQLFHVDGTNYIVRVGAIHTPVLSLPQMAQALVETTIGIMQAKSDQQLTMEDGPNGQRYIIEIPPVTPADADDDAGHLRRARGDQRRGLPHPGVRGDGHAAAGSRSRCRSSCGRTRSWVRRGDRPRASTIDARAR